MADAAALLNRCASQFQTDSLHAKFDRLVSMLTKLEPEQAEVELDSILSRLAIRLNVGNHQVVTGIKADD